MLIELILAKECKDTFMDLKMNRAHRWIIYKVESDNKTVTIDSVGARTSTFSEFTEKMPKTEPRQNAFCNPVRYAVYDMEITQPDGRQESKLLFFLYAPDEALSKVKFTYAAGKDSVKKSLGPLHSGFQVTRYIEIPIGQFAC